MQDEWYSFLCTNPTCAPLMSVPPNTSIVPPVWYANGMERSVWPNGVLFQPFYTVPMFNADTGAVYQNAYFENNQMSVCPFIEYDASDSNALEDTDSMELAGEFPSQNYRHHHPTIPGSIYCCQLYHGDGNPVETAADDESTLALTDSDSEDADDMAREPFEYQTASAHLTTDEVIDPDLHEIPVSNVQSSVRDVACQTTRRISRSRKPNGFYQRRVPGLVSQQFLRGSFGHRGGTSINRGARYRTVNPHQCRVCRAIENRFKVRNAVGAESYKLPWNSMKGFASSGAEAPLLNNRKVVVEQLPEKFSDRDLHAVFNSVGEISSLHICQNKATNRNFGFAFIEYKDAVHALFAVNNLNGLLLQNKCIKVSFLKQIREKCNSILVNNLPAQVTLQVLVQILTPFGGVESLQMIDGPQKSEHSKVLVRFATADQAENAKNILTGQVLENGLAPLQVDCEIDENTIYHNCVCDRQ